MAISTNPFGRHYDEQRAIDWQRYEYEKAMMREQALMQQQRATNERIFRMLRDPRCRQFYEQNGRWPMEGERFSDFEPQMQCQAQAPKLVERYNPSNYDVEEGKPRTEVEAEKTKFRKRRKCFWARYAKNKLFLRAEFKGI